jgi:pimeloyl-ACP methyl ester carboxylesterase
MMVRERDVMVEGRRLACLECGGDRDRSVPAIVLLHGLGGCARHWLHVLPALGERSRAVALDLPGFGRSETFADGVSSLARPSIAGRVSLERIADAVAQVVLALGLGPAVVVGHSFSGPVAIRFAARHPELAGGVVLVGGGVFQFSALLGLGRVGWYLRRRPLSTLAITAEALGAGLPLPHVARHVIARLAWLRRALLWPYVSDPGALSIDAAGLLLDGVGAPGVLPVVHAVGGSDPLEGIERVKCPVLSVAGARDLIVPIADTEELALRAADARTVVLDGCGHMVMLERPAELVRELSEFASICSTQARSDNDVFSQQ